MPNSDLSNATNLAMLAELQQARQRNDAAAAAARRNSAANTVGLVLIIANVALAFVLLPALAVTIPLTLLAAVAWVPINMLWRVADNRRLARQAAADQAQIQTMAATVGQQHTHPDYTPPTSAPAIPAIPAGRTLPNPQRSAAIHPHRSPPVNR